MPTVPEHETSKDVDPASKGASSSDVPPPPPGVFPPAAPAAPVLQAPQTFVDHAHDTPASRKLRRQQEQAARRGRRAFRWGNMGNLAHNPLNTQLPDHLSQIGSAEGERSILIIDNRDKRIQSPFQNWLLDEVLTNALSFVNLKSDRHLVRSPSSGYHFNLFMVKTLDSVKVIVTGSMTCYSHLPCARWDAATGEVLSHAAFQPFRWPAMTDSSPSWMDVKVKLEGHVLVHLELRGRRSDSDLSVQLWHIADTMEEVLSDTVFIPSVVVTIFQGWRVVCGHATHGCVDRWRGTWASAGCSRLHEIAWFAVRECLFPSGSLVNGRLAGTWESLDSKVFSLLMSFLYS